MKRLLTIILVILVIAAIFLGLSWLVSRRTAVKNGSAPLSFREFITGTDTGSTPNSGGPDELSSDFTNPNGGTLGTGTSGSSGSRPTSTADIAPGEPTTSIFTNGNLSPTGSPIGNGVPGDSASGSTTGTNSASNPISAPTSSPVAVECTDADLNITFTREEREKLQALQDRFYTIAQSLHNDGDVQTQLANYTAFKLKQKNTAELLDYCTNTLSPNLPKTAVYTKRVPTPFWYVEGDIRSNPTLTFFGTQPVVGSGAGGVPLGYMMDQGQIGGSVTGWRNDSTNFIRSMERLLRLNLW